MYLSELEEMVKKEGPGVHYIAEVRNDLVEALHRAHIAVVDPSGKLLLSSGNPHLVTYSRSCIKPIQALPILISGAADQYGLTDREIAIISGSHSGQSEHVELVRSILHKAELDESLLKCSGHAPFHKGTAKSIGENYTPLHDNCSGKHAGALLLCKFKGWDLESYLEPDHPLQYEILDVISSLTGIRKGSIHMGSDGCDIPNHVVPIDQMARMFALLKEPGGHPLSPHLKRVGRAMMEHPFMVAGKDRFDTVIMEDLKGSVLSKAGAAGLQTLAVEHDCRWIGVSLKIEDGAYSMIPPLTYSILENLGMRGTRSEKGEEYAGALIRTRSRKVVGRSVIIGKMTEKTISKRIV